MIGIVPGVANIVDLLDPTLHASGRAHGIYAELRQREPISWRGDYWAVMRHADVVTVGRDWQRFSSARGTGMRCIEHQPPLRSIHISDPPIHTEMRALVEDSYGHGWQKELATWIREEATRLIDAWRGEIDAVTTLADPLAFGVLERLLGQPVPELLPLVHRFSRYHERRYRRPNETPLECFQDAEREVWRLLRALVADRTASPRDDVPSRLLATGRLDYRDLMYALRFVVQTTYQTSALAIAACVDIVARAGEQLRSLPLDATARAADEVLRVSSPVIRFARHVVADTSLGDVPLRSGQRVVMFFPSANHDERVFEDPLRIDLTRAENPHVAFGAGIHTCLGAPIARLHLTAVLDALRGLELQQVQPARWYASSVNSGCDQVLVRRL